MLLHEALVGALELAWDEGVLDRPVSGLKVFCDNDIKKDLIDFFMATFEKKWNSLKTDSSLIREPNPPAKSTTFILHFSPKEELSVN